VQGSFDNPPIVIRSSKWKTALLLAVCIGFVAIGIFMLAGGKSANGPVWSAYLGIAFFGCGIPLFSMQLLRPDSLKLDPTGIIWRSVLRTTSWKWQDVRNFRPYRVFFSRQVGFDFSESYPGQKKLRATNRSLAGVEGALTGAWEIGPVELAKLLNAARERWVGSGQPSVRSN
jgi:hypothetical protein